MTTAEGKAIGWYAQQYDLRPQLSVPPAQINFTRSSNGEEVTVHLDLIKLEHRAHKKEESKRRAREMRLEKKR